MHQFVLVYRLKWWLKLIKIRDLQIAIAVWGLSVSSEPLAAHHWHWLPRAHRVTRDRLASDSSGSARVPHACSRHTLQKAQFPARSVPQPLRKSSRLPKLPLRRNSNDTTHADRRETSTRCRLWTLRASVERRGTRPPSLYGYRQSGATRMRTNARANNFTSRKRGNWGSNWAMTLLRHIWNFGCTLSNRNGEFSQATSTLFWQPFEFF